MICIIIKSMPNNTGQTIERNTEKLNGGIKRGLWELKLITLDSDAINKD